MGNGFHRPKSAFLAALLAPCLALVFAAAGAQSEEVSVTTQKLSDNLFMLQGKGGNVGLFIGADGVFLIDDDYAPVTPKIRAAINEQTDQPVRFVFNTHWHGDHTGGNEILGEAGATIVAHDNVRKRLSHDQTIKAFDSEIPATAAIGLPVITFAESIGFHLNGDDIDIVHVLPAHTDGDAYVHFKSANVIHAGDIFFNGFYPFIDAGSGGRIVGMIQASEQLLELADPDTQIIPGHGPLADRADLADYRDMLAAVQAKIQALIDAGESREQIIAAKPTDDFDAQWGDGFLPTDKWVGIVYDSMQ